MRLFIKVVCIHVYISIYVWLQITLENVQQCGSTNVETEKKEKAPTYPTHSVLGATGPMGRERVLESRKIGFKGSSALW